VVSWAHRARGVAKARVNANARYFIEII
jgi:hypothetical protein